MPARPVAAALKKSDRTRLAILTAAREQFAEHGYDRANIRAIAARASIDPSMVIRYFTSKEALFAAAVDVDLRLPDLTSVPKARRGRALAQHLFTVWEGDDSSDVMLILLRSAVTNEKVAQRLRTVFLGQVVAMIAPVVDEDEVERRAALVASQLLGVVLTRRLLRLPGIVERPIDEVVADLAPTVQRYLSGRLP